MPHYNANTKHKESYPREILIGYNIVLAELVYASELSSKAEMVVGLTAPTLAFGCELQNHRYPKLTNELRNRNIIRVCMENLSIVI